MRYLTFTILLFSLFSCSKYSHEIKEYELFGEYEWYYSLDGPVNSVSFDQVEHQYGIRFRESGKVCFYKDGKLVDKYKIVGMREADFDFDGDLELTYKIDKFNSGKLILDGSDLIHSEWPFESMRNKFLKTSQ